MRKRQDRQGTIVWLSEQDTHKWASRPGDLWPCSFLSGRRVCAQYDARGDLIDVSIDGGLGDQDCPSYEFDAIMEHFLGSAHPEVKP